MSIHFGSKKIIANKLSVDLFWKEVKYRNVENKLSVDTVWEEVKYGNVEKKLCRYCLGRCKVWIR